jgi:hypothetical protein
MNNADAPASPISVSSSIEGNLCSSDFEYGEGLTKREHFAGLAMQGLLASPEGKVKGTKNEIELSRVAVIFADALLKELEK